MHMENMSSVVLGSNVLGFQGRSKGGTPDGAANFISILYYLLQSGFIQHKGLS